MFIRSEEALASGDADTYQDIYESAGSTLTRLSLGPAGGNGPMHAFFGGISEDGTRVFFETYESLDAGDTDANVDVYERFGGATDHLSAGAGGGNGIFDATFRAVSADGGRVFFRTAESLLAADTDGAADVYSANVPGTVNGGVGRHPGRPPGLQLHRGGRPQPIELPARRRLRGTLPNTRSFAGLAPGSGYSVSQAMPTGLEQGERDLRRRQPGVRYRRRRG